LDGIALPRGGYVWVITGMLGDKVGISQALVPGRFTRGLSG